MPLGPSKGAVVCSQQVETAGLTYRDQLVPTWSYPHRYIRKSK